VANGNGKSKKKKLFIIAAIIVVALIIGIVIMGFTRGGSKIPDDKKAKVEQGPLAKSVVATGKVDGSSAGLGGNGGSTTNAKLGLYYHATTNAAIVVVDIKSRKLAQKVPTSVEARSLDVSLASGRVYLATTANNGPCGGCIQVFAPE